MPDTPDPLEPWIIPEQGWVLISLEPPTPNDEAEPSD